MNKWNHKKSKTRKHVQSKKRNRGRQSGAATKTNYHQNKLIDEGYAKINHLLYNLIKKEYNA